MMEFKGHPKSFTACILSNINLSISMIMSSFTTAGVFSWAVTLKFWLSLIPNTYLVARKVLNSSMFLRSSFLCAWNPTSSCTFLEIQEAFLLVAIRNLEKNAFMKATVKTYFVLTKLQTRTHKKQKSTCLEVSSHGFRATLQEPSSGLGLLTLIVLEQLGLGDNPSGTIRVTDLNLLEQLGLQT